jgi:hypothetical protein
MRGRRARGEESVGGYFRERLRKRPELLDAKSNEILMKMWDADHPNQTPERRRNVVSNLANVKSMMRKQRREGKLPGVPRGRSSGGMLNSSKPSLETLEEYIDDGMALAKSLDREGLDEVIRLLRRARNQVVWKIGQ